MDNKHTLFEWIVGGITGVTCLLIGLGFAFVLFAQGYRAIKGHDSRIDVKAKIEQVEGLHQGEE